MSPAPAWCFQPDRIEVVDRGVVAVLRTKSGMERLRLAHEAWELARDRLTAFLSARHPEWDSDAVRRQVARRLAQIDTRCVDEWARRLGVTDVWETVRRRAEGE